jgi:hypothetical protein
MVTTNDVVTLHTASVAKYCQKLITLHAEGLSITRKVSLLTTTPV